jgi:hypothetical protein
VSFLSDKSSGDTEALFLTDLGCDKYWACTQGVLCNFERMPSCRVLFLTFP